MSAEKRNFPRSGKLLIAADYNHVFQDPEKSVDGCFTVFWRDNNLEHPRLGLAISKKNSRRAIDRNRVKRLIRESYRHQLNRLPNVDIVILSRHRISGCSNQRIFSSLHKHWEKLIQNG